MSKITITRKNCQQCGRSLKHYYYYCTCGNEDVTDWGKTFVLLATFFFVIAIILITILSSMFEKLCSNDGSIIGSIVFGMMDVSCK